MNIKYAYDLRLKDGYTDYYEAEIVRLDFEIRLIRSVMIVSFAQATPREEMASLAVRFCEILEQQENMKENVGKPFPYTYNPRENA